MKMLLSSHLMQEILHRTKLKVSASIDAGYDPQLAAVLVGNDPNSLRYLEMKTKHAKEVGIILSIYHLEEDSTFEQIQETVGFLAQDSDIHGIIVQLPLPDHFSVEQTNQIIQGIPSVKDVDGLRGDWRHVNYANASLENFWAPHPFSLPPMVSSVLSLLSTYEIDIKGKKIVLVGKGRLVGAPLLAYLQAIQANVEAVDETTNGIIDIAQSADILISGTGQKELVTYQWVKTEAVVIDCAADVHVDSVSQVASALAPSKGGVGPLTMAWLLYNTAQAAANQFNLAI